MQNTSHNSSQYHAAIAGAGVFVNGNRATIEVTGADRANWLSNLVTNVVKTLKPGEGNYAFATNVKGRTVFDLNILVLEDRLWLDIAAAWRDRAMAHLNKYIITEDVALADKTSVLSRVAVMGPRAVEIVQAIGFGNLGPMANLQHLSGRIGGADVVMVRNDFAGLTTAEFIVPIDSVASAQAAIAGAVSGFECGQLTHAAVEVLRIEAGIPLSGSDIDEEVVPPETGQIERGISYHKGCYLGQEVIERMRSHGILARKLVGLKLDGESLVTPGSVVRRDGKEIGRITSACWSEAVGGPLALGYLKTLHIQPETSVSVDDAGSERTGVVVALPVRGKA